MRVMSEKIMGYIMLYVDQYFCDMLDFPQLGKLLRESAFRERLPIAIW